MEIYKFKIRGATWFNHLSDCKCPFRNGLYIDDRLHYIGSIFKI